RSLDHDLMAWHGEVCRARELLFYSFDDVMWTERFTIVLTNVTLRRETGFRTQVTGELTRIVVFYNNDALAPRENAADLLSVKRNNPFNLEMVCNDALLRGEFLDRLTNDALGRAPTNERDRGILRSMKSRWRDLRPNRLHFASAFLNHHSPFNRISEFITY